MFYVLCNSNVRRGLGIVLHGCYNCSLHKTEWFIYSGCVMVCMDKINYAYFYNHLTLL